jgi:hypothetical protein
MSDMEFMMPNSSELRKLIRKAFEAGFNAGIDSEFKYVKNTNKYMEQRRSTYLLKTLGKKTKVD